MKLYDSLAQKPVREHQHFFYEDPLTDIPPKDDSAKVSTGIILSLNGPEISFLIKGGREKYYSTCKEYGKSVELSVLSSTNHPCKNH